MRTLLFWVKRTRKRGRPTGLNNNCGRYHHIAISISGIKWYQFWQKKSVRFDMDGENVLETKI